MTEPERSPPPGDGSFSNYTVPTVTDQDLELVAAQKVLEYESHSQLVQRSRHCQVAQFQWSDLQVGELLGSGTFASAYHVCIKRSQDAQNSLSILPQSHAIKVLHEKSLADRRTFLAGAVDLAIEAKLLAGLCHENIIGLHGVRAGSFQESLASCDYFLILDLLVQTLQEYLKHEQIQWMQTQPKWLRWRRQYDARLVRRLETIAVGVARGMEYLHSQSVCFRDLKPANVGFDARGIVKVFDFGLAREVYGNKKLGGRPVGSPRYMAPEVARCEPYSLSADVYSFGIVLWELCSLQKPYRDVNDVSQYRNRIVLGNERPSLNDACFRRRSSQLKILLQGCWHPLPHCRPSFTTVCRELETELKGNYEIDAKQRRLLPTFPSLRIRRGEEGRRQGQGEKGRLFWQRGPGKDAKSMTSYHEEEEVVFEHNDGPVDARSNCLEL